MDHSRLHQVPSSGQHHCGVWLRLVPGYTMDALRPSMWRHGHTAVKQPESETAM